MTDATASSISPTISLPCEANDAWLAWRVIVFFAFMRSAKKRSVSGGIMRSFAEIWNQLGFTFQAGGPDFSSKQRPEMGFCERAITSASVSSRFKLESTSGVRGVDTLHPRSLQGDDDCVTATTSASRRWYRTSSVSFSPRPIANSHWKPSRCWQAPWRATPAAVARPAVCRCARRSPCHF